MADNQDNPDDILLKEQIDTAIEASNSGNHDRSLSIFGDLFKSGQRSQALYDGAARAAVVAILEGALTAGPASRAHDQLFRHLILQPERFDAPPALHFQIASSHSSGTPGVLDKAAAALTPALKTLWEEGERGASLLTLMLLLRERLGDWCGQQALSRWHLDLLPELDAWDMQIPYNAMFKDPSFARSIADIAQLMEQIPAGRLAERFTPAQLILFHWIIGGGRLDWAIPEILAAQRSGAMTPVTERDEAALRSLTLRMAASGRAAALTDGLDPDLAALAEGWSGMHAAAVPALAERAKARLGSRKRQAVHAALDMARRRVPFLHLGRRRPRIAVCISGQLRGYQRAFPTWQAGLLRGTEYRIVVHSWEKVGRSGAEPYRAYLPFEGAAFCETYRAHAHRAGMDEMRARYPQLFVQLQQGGIVTHTELEAFYGTDQVLLEDDAAERFAGWSNSRKMHHKLAEAAKMVANLDTEFDLMLRVRPDKQLGLVAFSWADMLGATHASPTIFSDGPMGHQYGDLLIGDQVALGAPAPMAVYADAVDLVPEFARCQLFRCRPNHEGHVSLALTCWHAGIDVRRFPVQMGDLLEAAPMRAEEIAACLEQDSAGRMDAMDQALIAANRTDLSSRA